MIDLSPTAVHQVRNDSGSGRIAAECGERPGPGVRFGLSGVREGPDAVTCAECLHAAAVRREAARERRAAYGRASAARRWGVGVKPDYATSTVDAAAAVAARADDPEPYWPPEADRELPGDPGEGDRNEQWCPCDGSCPACRGRA